MDKYSFGGKGAEPQSNQRLQKAYNKVCTQCFKELQSTNHHDME